MSAGDGAGRARGTPLDQKSTTDEIRRRFDNDVERFSNLRTGQAAAIDAPLSMELITRAAMAATPNVHRFLDLGCGAGNNAIALRQALGNDVEIDLLDLSKPMLERAAERVGAINRGQLRLHHGDFRALDLEPEAYDVIVAAAVLHHLRTDEDWRQAFQKLFRVLRPGGGLWITDLVAHELPGVQDMMWERYGHYLASLRDDEYRDQVFDYIDREDSPRPVTYQLDLLRQVGFRSTELLHKNSCFAAFGAVKPG